MSILQTLKKAYGEPKKKPVTLTVGKTKTKGFALPWTEKAQATVNAIAAKGDTNDRVVALGFMWQNEAGEMEFQSEEAQELLRELPVQLFEDIWEVLSVASGQRAYAISVNEKILGALGEGKLNGRDAIE